MIRYVGKRILMMIPVLIGVALIIYLIMAMMPGDPAVRILGNDAGPDALAAMRERLGLDKPFMSRFLTYMGNLFIKLDFGNSWRTNQSVWKDLAPRIVVSLKLALISMCFAILIGVPFGVYSAVKQYSFGDNLLRVFSTILVAVPTFWFAMLLILLFALTLHWLPSGGTSNWTGYILPMITCGGPTGCSLLRMTRSTMLEEIRQDYVRTARAKGVPNQKVIYKHALRNALLPVISLIGSGFSFIIGGSVISESVFSIAGVGSLIILSINTIDVPTVTAGVIVVAFFYAVVMLIVDLTYAFIDPRIRAKYTRKV
ncbi:MAG TPA: ABC transporter permease [Bacillota bacterium]|nr:ABC transporter permease [Bacillota bacterium]HQC35717.1 ABC transporter permease [Bacillota bacterium]